MGGRGASTIPIPAPLLLFYFDVATKYGSSLNVWIDGGDVCTHSNVVLQFAVSTVSKNSAPFQFCTPTATLSDSNLYTR